MRAKYIYEILKESYGAGFSMARIGGMAGLGKNSFGGASNMGGANMMYTYEIKPLNHTLEQLPVVNDVQDEQIQIGSKISGFPVASNATPLKNKVTGIVHKIVKSDNGAIKYYIIQDEATQNKVKLEPLSVKLIIAEPVQYYFNATDNIPSRRYGKRVKESLKEEFKEDSDPIDDLEIGMMHQIKRWIKDIKKDIFSPLGKKRNEEDYLWICAENNKLEFAKYLLDKGYNVNYNDGSALQWACYLGHVDMVKLLLKYGANVFADNSRSYKLAKEENRKEVVKILDDHIKKLDSIKKIRNNNL